MVIATFIIAIMHNSAAIRLS